MCFEHFLGTFVLLYITENQNLLLQLLVLFKHLFHFSHGILYLHLPSRCFSHRTLLPQQCRRRRTHQPLHSVQDIPIATRPFRQRGRWWRDWGRESGGESRQEWREGGSVQGDLWGLPFQQSRG